MAETVHAQPDSDLEKPSPDVTVQNLTNQYSFGEYILGVEISEAGGVTTLDLTLTNEDGDPLTGIVLCANVWLVDGDLDPANVAADAVKVSATPPDTSPVASEFRLALIDGAGSISLEHAGSQADWYVVVELNSFLTVLGPYLLGV